MDVKLLRAQSSTLVLATVTELTARVIRRLAGGDIGTTIGDEKANSAAIRTLVNARLAARLAQPNHPVV